MHNVKVIQLPRSVFALESLKRQLGPKQLKNKQNQLLEKNFRRVSLVQCRFRVMNHPNLSTVGMLSAAFPVRCLLIPVAFHHALSNVATSSPTYSYHFRRAEVLERHARSLFLTAVVA